MLRNATIVCIMLPLAGCMSQSQIQGRYTEQQNACRAEASVVAPLASSDSAAVGARFSECMNKAGWHVSQPKPGGAPPTNVAQNPPTGAPSTNPSASTSGVAPPRQTAVVSPPSGAPSTAPSAAAARVVAPGAATYQPARPAAAAPSVPMAPAYGQGAGRQF